MVDRYLHRLHHSIGRRYSGLPHQNISIVELAGLIVRHGGRLFLGGKVLGLPMVSLGKNEKK